MRVLILAVLGPLYAAYILTAVLWCLVDTVADGLDWLTDRIAAGARWLEWRARC